MQRRTRKRLTLASRIEFLDAATCDSTIGYSIVRGRRGMSASADLSDCNRKINWYFEDSTDGIRKLQRAIDVLTEFRDKLRLLQRRRGKTRLTRVL